jgi:hypothetical protein
MLLGLSALMGQREINRTCSHGISYVRFLLQFADIFRIFYIGQKSVRYMKTCAILLTFRHYVLMPEKNCVLVSVQAEVEKRDDDLKLTIVNGP